jgi:hypothetical protein
MGILTKWDSDHDHKAKPERRFPCTTEKQRYGNSDRRLPSHAPGHLRESFFAESLRIRAVGPHVLETACFVAETIRVSQNTETTIVKTRYKQTVGGILSEEWEVKALLGEDKWLATLAPAIQGERDRVSQTLTGRPHQRAEQTLEELTKEVDALAERVGEHLQKMGAGRN